MGGNFHVIIILVFSPVKASNTVKEEEEGLEKEVEKDLEKEMKKEDDGPGAVSLKTEPNDNPCHPVQVVI